uniref:Adapter molecule Crk n=1 Tax=Bactrocera latifrons TaxID=174628 RepID=A0A0K8UZH7_BACLA
MDTFDVSDRDSWYFGPMSRQDATEVLMNERDRGVFLVRDSNSIAGDYVLCVREDTKVSNYIINKIQQQDQVLYRIGDQLFENLQKLLTFYTLHYLDTTPLRRPAPKKAEKVIGRYDFEGSCEENTDDNCTDRPLSSGGNCGTTLAPGNSFRSPPLSSVACKDDSTIHSTSANCHQLSNSLKRSDLNRKLPAFARVKQARVPNAYDKTALKLEIGNVIKVTKTNINGQWEGELNGKKGHFPFTHVEFIDDCDPIHNAEDATLKVVSVSSLNNDWVE